MRGGEPGRAQVLRGMRRPARRDLPGVRQRQRARRAVLRRVRALPRPVRPGPGGPASRALCEEFARAAAARGLTVRRTAGDPTPGPSLSCPCSSSSATTTTSPTPTRPPPPGPESARLRRLLRRYPVHASSTLTRAEVLRAIRRVEAGAVRRVHEAMEKLVLIEVTKPLLTTAGMLDPVELRTLDAISLDGRAIARIRPGRAGHL